MSRKHFDDECPGCRPAMVDAATGQPIADDSVEMTTVNRLWSETTFGERRAWHRFTCQNSRRPEDVQFAKTFAERIGEAFTAAAKKKENN